MDGPAPSWMTVLNAPDTTQASVTIRFQAPRALARQIAATVAYQAAPLYEAGYGFGGGDTRDDDSEYAIDVEYVPRQPSGCPDGT